ncbi:hypothetical protein AB0J83_11790 [Actinoplanes sp. NPDC049596]|uniref:hypothetical protein n=1 Tax=unclassified Actinoplanes TaxID=2626549 RepID=UPI003437EE27
MDDSSSLLSGPAGYAFREEPAAEPPSAPTAAGPSAAGAAPTAATPSVAADPSATWAAPADDELPTEEFPVVPPLRPGVPRRSRSRAAALIGAAVLVGGALVTYGLVSNRAEPAKVAAPPGPAAAPPGAPGPAFDAGTVDLAGDVGELNLSLGRTADGPVQASASAGAVSVRGTAVRVASDPADPARLDVLLDERIAWTIHMNGGARRATFVLTGGTVRGIDLSGGAETVSLTLPRVERALPIRMSGGVREWSIRTEGEVPVRVRVQSGAGEVSLYGNREHGIAPDTTLTAGAGSGLDVTAAAGFGTLAVSAP